MDPERVGEAEPPPSWPALALLGGVAVATASLVIAAVDGSPYLSLSSLSPWIAIFATALFVALFAVPFAANLMIVGGDPDRAEAWEAAMLAWGAIALALLAIGALLSFPAGVAPAHSLVDAVGLLLVLEAGMVVAVLLFWVLSG